MALSVSDASLILRSPVSYRSLSTARRSRSLVEGRMRELCVSLSFSPASEGVRVCDTGVSGDSGKTTGRSDEGDGGAAGVGVGRSGNTSDGWARRMAGSRFTAMIQAPLTFSRTGTKLSSSNRSSYATCRATALPPRKSWIFFRSLCAS